jgi:hypothetical protein
MDKMPKVSAKKNPGLQDDHDPSDIGQRAAGKPKQQRSQMEGPAAYAPHDEGEKGQKPADATKQKPDT